MRHISVHTTRTASSPPSSLPRSSTRTGPVRAATSPPGEPRCLARRRLGLRALSVAAVLVALSPAAAQDAEVERARSLFIEASEAVQDARWAEAAELFEDSYALSGAPTALFNAAAALQSLGRFRDAVQAYERLLSAHPDAAEAILEQARTRLRAARARLATLRLVGLAPAQHVITVDGGDRPDEGQRPVVLREDPGDHNVVVRLPGHVPFVWDGRLTSGEERSLAVELVESGEDSVDVRRRRRRLAAILTSLLVVAAAGAVTAWAVTREPTPLEPAFANTVEL